MNSHTVYKITKSQLPEAQIIDEKLFHVFVFSLPRSGSSMMTHICELLGVKMLHTTEEKENQHDYKHLGGEYHPNPNGFFEVAKDTMEHYFELAATPYSGCKMIIPVRGPRLDLVKMLPSKIVMMWRDPEEIRQSQNAFYAKDADIAYIKTSLVQEKMKLEKQKLDFIIVHYRDVINDPRKEIQRVKKFIHSDQDIEEAVNFVNPASYRFDRDKITEGL